MNNDKEDLTIDSLAELVITLQTRLNRLEMLYRVHEHSDKNGSIRYPVEIFEGE